MRLLLFLLLLGQALPHAPAAPVVEILETRVITEQPADWDLGYSNTVQLADGALLSVWYETPKGTHQAVLRQARWTLNR